ncbi:MAG: ABC transporter permease [Syntrophorhabdus aromaticivorans]|uniref:ABC transporter permease n=1 Tax=Syntrophorhabdus aromaticivorans TaxID=328301 RepID=A0A351U615_9BACT|nr:ABC transporter permease [Syntrophorhabdus aromaticivorans]HBA55396.1 ABC transporter permease [Syntrophorhabdus aromaticivorans]
MNTLILAIKNIFKNRRRTVITFLAITSGMTGLIVFGGYMEFTFMGLRESTIRTQLGHVQVAKKGYFEKGLANQGKYLIRESESVERVLARMPEVKLVTSRLTFSGLISTGERTLSCKGFGINVAEENAGDMNTFETVVDGQQLDESTGPGDGVVGVELMKALGAKVGDYLTLLTTTIDGTMNALEFKVVGVAETGSKEYDSVFVKLPLPFVKRLVNCNAVEKFMVLLNDTDDLGKATKRINGLLATDLQGMEYRTWSELADFYLKVERLYRGIFDIIIFIVGIIVLFSIANTITMSVFERTREIGTLRAIGTTRLGTMRLFLTEGVLIGIIGGIIGILVGIMVAYAINFSGGIYVPPPPGQNRGYLAMVLIVPQVILYAFASIVGVSALSSLYPSFKASRLKIVEALHHI